MAANSTILFYRAGQYGRLDTLNSKIYPLFQILDTDPGWCNNSRERGAAGGGAGAVHLACSIWLFKRLEGKISKLIRSWNLRQVQAVPGPQWNSPQSSLLKDTRRSRLTLCSIQRMYRKLSYSPSPPSPPNPAGYIAVTFHRTKDFINEKIPLSRFYGGLEGPFGTCWGPLAPS